MGHGDVPLDGPASGVSSVEFATGMGLTERPEPLDIRILGISAWLTNSCAGLEAS